MLKLSSSERSSLIKLAASLPTGSLERRAILSGLKRAAKTRRDPDLQKRVEKKLWQQSRSLREGLYVMDQGWDHKGGGELDHREYAPMFNLRLKSLDVSDQFYYDRRRDEDRTTVVAVLEPATEEGKALARGLRATGETGESLTGDRNGLLTLRFEYGVEASPAKPEGLGVHY